VVWLSAFTARQREPREMSAQQFWSPYYRIDFNEPDLSLSVNLIYHQQMVREKKTFRPMLCLTF
jgi:hypothetical protein